ncbi:gamma-glutamylcyclotransferase family protein [Bacillus pinisoli]|uniref:gamma-glutamylcyclotransferase family protein n=1 Tax=Bacillus pinisoli TaxID=2901866 RepID=UPI001FF57AD9|nr:gamma-glutamylcyclotransferase family protein [Bacillus pinisoli]
MTTTHNVFVYGTLCNGESNHHLLKNSRCLLKSCWTHGQLFDSGLGYPAIKKCETNIVLGELYTVTDEVLKQLDKLEDFEEGGHLNLYNRVIQTIYTHSNQLKAFVYIANDFSLLKTPIKSGDWPSYRNALL